MVHVNASLRRPPQPVYAQRNPARRGSTTGASDAPKTTTATGTSGGSTSSGSSSASSASNDPGADFRAIFSGKPAPADTTPTPPPSAPPTAQSVFGANPWIANPGGTGPNGASYSYNPYYFATPATAAKVAQMLGGTVVERNDVTPNGPFQQNQPNEMVQLSNGKLVNAGIIASFYDHGFSQQYVNMLVTNEVSG